MLNIKDNNLFFNHLKVQTRAVLPNFFINYFLSFIHIIKT